jgi:hypothetical protein
LKAETYIIEEATIKEGSSRAFLLNHDLDCGMLKVLMLSTEAIRRWSRKGEHYERRTVCEIVIDYNQKS